MKTITEFLQKRKLTISSNIVKLTNIIERDNDEAYINIRINVDYRKTHVDEFESGIGGYIIYGGSIEECKKFLNVTDITTAIDEDDPKVFQKYTKPIEEIVFAKTNKHITVVTLDGMYDIPNAKNDSSIYTIAVTRRKSIESRVQLGGIFKPWSPYEINFKDLRYE